MRSPRGCGQQLDLLGGEQRTEFHGKALDEAEEAYKLFDTQTTGKAVILPS
jgi:hypothetical protein